MDQEDYRKYPRNSVVDERFGEPDFNAWGAFDSSGFKKVDALRALHLTFRSLGRSIDDARKQINTFSTVAYRLDGQGFTSDATNNSKFYSENDLFGKYYLENLRLDEKETEVIRSCLESDWGNILTQALQTTAEAVLSSVFSIQDQLVIELTEGAVRNGYIPIQGDETFFPSDYFGAANEQPETPKFTLDLPGGESVTTDIRSPSGKGGRIRSRFADLFSRLGITPQMKAVICKIDSGLYSLSFRPFREKRATIMPNSSLNQILYGPPGTGKTYATVSKSLEILEPEFAATNANDRSKLRKRFEELSVQGRIEFVTFHQSFSYEDFVEGLRATSEDGKISYDVDDGVFKRICILDQAVVEKSSHADIDIGNRKIWKMSLGDTQGQDSYIYEHCIEQNEIRLGYGSGLDFSSAHDSKQIAEVYQQEEIETKTQDYKVTSVNTFKNKINTGDLIVVSDGNKKFRAIGEVTGDYEFKPDDNLMSYAQCRAVVWHKAWGRSLPYDQLLNKTFSQMTLYQLKPKVICSEKLAELLGADNVSEGGNGEPQWLKPGTQFGNGGYEITYVSEDVVRVLVRRTGSIVSFDMTLLQELARYATERQITIEDIKKRRVFDKTESSLEKYIVNGYPGLLAQVIDGMTAAEAAPAPAPAQVVPNRPRVLIIDEINRGNIANIFGELITLIEPSKRAGAAEATEVTLPYSKEKFSVPSNIYIIGTMNTADRSLVHVDTALRRRFTFVETPPDLDVLKDISVEGVNIRSLLETINNRIELIYDRDHRIGHSYFLPLKAEPTIEKLASIFSGQVIPLLEEYFFDDWSRIQQILRSKEKATSYFVEPKFSDEDVQSILGDEADQIGTVYQKSTSALSEPTAYICIYQSSDEI